MRLFCISDLHGNIEALDFSKADVVVIPGDFARMYGWGKWHLNDMKKWIQKKFISFTQKYPNVDFAIIPGNHDLIFDVKYTNVYPDMNYNIDWPNNVHFLIDKLEIIRGITFYGTPWVPIINHRWAFEAEHDKLIDHFREIPEKLDILITHSPPRIPETSIDYSMQTDNGPFGSSELAQAIFEKQPRYVFCGHIHSGDHNLVYFNNSKIYNVSRLDEKYEIAYEPLVLDVFELKI